MRDRAEEPGQFVVRALHIPAPVPPAAARQVMAATTGVAIHEVTVQPQMATPRLPPSSSTRTHHIQPEITEAHARAILRYSVVRPRPSACAARVRLPWHWLMACWMACFSSSSRFSDHAPPRAPAAPAVAGASTMPSSGKLPFSLMITARSTACLSSRTLPGQRYCCSRAMAPSEIASSGRPYLRA